MSKQFSLLATDRDLRALEHMLRGINDVQLLSDVPTEDLAGLLPLSTLVIPPSEAGRISLFCYLAPTSQPTKVFIDRVSPAKTNIDEQNSELIEFWRPFYDGNMLRAGRLYVQNRVMIDGKPTNKSAEFCGWADRVLRALRKSLVRDSRLDIYVGADAAAAITSGRVRVVV